jgi:hypothetical protein
MAEQQSSALSPLPLPLVLHIFSLLPADVRARAACVCRGWRVTLDEVSLWTRLNLSPSSGVRVRVTDAVLADAAAKARGQLAALDVSECARLTFDALLAVVRANAGALRELRVGTRAYNGQTLKAEHAESLCLAAPQLTACHAELNHWSSFDDARRMLRNEPPFEPLRLRSLLINFKGEEDEASVVGAVADLAAHASLKHVWLGDGPPALAVALDAVMDAALAREWNSFGFVNCSLSPASAPALARLLSGGALTELAVEEMGQQLLDAPAAALLGDALRANATLTKLSLTNLDLWHDPDAAATLLSALTAHHSMRNINVWQNPVLDENALAAGTALGALIAANASALTELDMSQNDLGDAGLRPLLDALPHNTHLRELDVSDNGMSEAFARDVLLPAVRANTGLRELTMDDDDDGAAQECAFRREAQALLAARRAAAAAAE